MRSILLMLACCGQEPSPHACLVGRTCPDASVDAPVDAQLIPCSDIHPTPIPGACVDYLCLDQDGRPEVVGICWPKRRAGDHEGM